LINSYSITEKKSLFYTSSNGEFALLCLKKIVQSWPNNMSAQEAYNRIISLVAEDYASMVKKLDSLDPTKSNIKQPGGREISRLKK
jgi:hypothetical protein